MEAYIPAPNRSQQFRLDRVRLDRGCPNEIEVA